MIPSARRRLSRRLVRVLALLSLAAVSTTVVAAAAVTRSSGTSLGRSAPKPNRILYRENWERGALDATQWGAQCKNLTGVDFTTGSLTPERAIVAQGRWAARFDLPPDPTRSSSCEVIHNRTLDVGADDYYGLDVYFPTNWREPGDQPRSFWGLALAQFNFEDIYGGPVSLLAHKRYVNLVILTGYINGTRARWFSGNGTVRGNVRRMYAIPRPLKLGVWHQLIVHIHWSAGSDGAVDTWHRLGGQRWNRTVHLRGLPTVQWSATKPPTPSMQTWDKFGAYRGQSSSPLTIWADGYCRGSSFRAAASCL